MKTLCTILLLCLSFMWSSAQEGNAQTSVTMKKSSQKAFIDILQNDEKFTIHFSSKGCFHNTKEMLTFQKEDNNYYVIFQEKRKKLDSVTLENIRNFEKELLLQQDNGCTTVDNYLLIYKDTQRIITDGSCKWNGYHKLKKLLHFTS